jgi:tetratricopeptide (TPR) repeat protein
MKVSLRLSRVVVLIATIVGLQIVVSAQNRISGRILTADRRPVGDVYVELLTDVNRVVLRTRAAGSGTFFFSGMGTGRYNVRVLPSKDFEEAVQEVQIVNLSMIPNGGFSSEDVTIYVKPRRMPVAEKLGPAVVFAQDTPPEAKRSFDKAVSDIDVERFDSGIAELENAIRLFPTYFMALERLGVQKLREQKFQESEALFERATKVNQKASFSWYGIAFSAYANGDTPKALLAAKKAAELSPASPEIALVLGIVLRKDKQFAVAESTLLKAKKLSEGLVPDVFWNLALLYAHDLKNFKLAADELENYLKAKPNHPDAELLKRLVKEYRSKAAGA